MASPSCLEERRVAVLVFCFDVRPPFIDEKPGDLVLPPPSRLEQQGIRSVSMKLFSDELAQCHFPE